ncbi:MAG: aminotransferase class V-fold PLP-dependent enzyme [Firmicutes bacterium]|nr:aminotransferase class V-fold PLP-dependent enzyme [Bacillota bacterium]
MIKSDKKPEPQDVEKFRHEFPMLGNADAPVYFDNAATTLKPECVIKAVEDYYYHFCANINRGLYESSLLATKKYESARTAAAAFIGALPEEIVFTPNTTYAINMVAASLPVLVGDRCRKKILIPFSEHHSNMIPWMNLERRGFYTEFIRVDQAGRIDLNDFYDRLDRTTAIVASSIVSNVSGVINPVVVMAEAAGECGALFLADAAQAAAHVDINVKKLGVDFLALSGHKIYAPPGSGILYGKTGLLEKMEPIVWGGGTVSSVRQDGFEPAAVPKKLEPGTPDIPAFSGLEAALGFVSDIGFDYQQYEKSLLEYCVYEMAKIPGLKIPGFVEEGTSFFNERSAIIPFTLKGWDCSELPVVLDKQAKIAIRSGFHCAQPFTCSLSPEGVHRVSFAPYNTKKEIDLFIGILAELAEL